MNFTELFAKLPTSSFQDWEAAARAQLKGKPLESINISLGDGSEVAPYAIGNGAGIVGGGSQGWFQFSSFSSDIDVSADLLLDALNGGAQGLEISFQDFAKIAPQLNEVRFDFISLKINNLKPNDQDELITMIPASQRKGAKLLVALFDGGNITDYQRIVDEFSEVIFLLSPKLHIGDLQSLRLVFEGMKSQLSADDSLRFLASDKVALGCEVMLSADYTSNITYIHALRLLFANTFNSFGMEQPLPRPYLFGRIVPEKEVESHEVYLIDATAKAVAGISGGIDALTIEAYPSTDVLVAARRVRNIQNVLAIEGLLGIPLSAVKGAAYFEATAKALMSSVWPDY